MKFEKLALIGCGLMGGSFALALKKAGLVDLVMGYSVSERTRQKALDLGVIDAMASNVVTAVQGADLVLVAVPVSATQATFAALAPALSAQALLMDVGSTKTDVVAAAMATLGERLPCFVPAHPIAGKEVAGVEHADADLYQNRQLILTPMATSGLRKIAQAHDVWEALGSHVITLNPEQHDATFAAVSHLPHLVAFALVNAVAQQPKGADHLSMAGPGFRDFSRIAASDPTVWRDILLANRAHVMHQSNLLRQALDQLETAMAEGNAQALENLITQASQTRAQWRLGGHATSAGSDASDPDA
jgi:prephenate dehydrogenase